MPIEKINTNLLGLPPAWISRAVSRSSAMGNADEIKKILGEPIPQLVNPSQLSPKIAKFFETGGLLDRLRKKLSIFSRKKGGKMLPARNTIAAVDEDDNVYVGVDFLEQFGDDEQLIAGILAHEWGHMMSDLPRNMDWSRFTWDQLHAMRRDEEGDADAFAGRALFLLGSSVEPMIAFLTEIERRKEEKNLVSHKYHHLVTRVAILREAYEAEKRALETAKRIFLTQSSGNAPKIGRIIGAG